MQSKNRRPERAKSPVVVGVGCDEKYAVGLAVTIRSMLDHRKDPEQPFKIYIFDGGFTPETRKRLLASWEAPNVTIEFIKPPPKLYRGFPKLLYLGWSTYFRVLAADLLPKEDAIIFLDADLLVLRDVSELWKIDLGNRLCAAAVSSRSPWFSSVPALFTFSGLGYPFDAPYYDIGVSLYNLAQWREDGIRERISAWIDNHKERLFFGEQDAMNALFYGRWHTLDQRWDTEFPTAEQDRIIHFLGGRKPWKPNCRHPATELYFEYIDRTEWRGFRPPRRARKGPPNRFEVLF
jgi:lipopolysaccharide biosynthesis glycosyltransferase